MEIPKARVNKPPTIRPSGNQMIPNPIATLAAPAICNAVAMSSLKIHRLLVSRTLVLFY